MKPTLTITLMAALAIALAAPAGAASKARRASARPRAVAPAEAKPAPAERRLEDVHIEGELEVPRVTFITVRQPHRYKDFTRPASVRTSRRMADGAASPAWISPAPQPAPEARKENRK